MSAVLAPRAQGLSRLLDDCAAFARVTGGDPVDPRGRLARELGPDLASRLVAALAARPRTSGRSRQRA